MIDKVIETIDKNKMLNYGDKVIVGVSGGPDSMSLLHILIKLKDKYGLSLYAAHVNHSLRGIESDQDEEFVREYCRKEGIGFYSRKVDIGRISSERGVSTETTGREERYAFFKELKDELHADKIALAHNANDQAETILMRIIRGTGIEGLAGIKPVRDGIFIRPLIEIARTEIEKYCEENGIEPRIDRTNSENIYSRNKIRLELIPYLNNNFKCNIVDGLNRLSKIIEKDNEFLELEAEKRYEAFCSSKDGKVIISKDAFKEHESVLTRIIRKSLESLTGSLYNFEKVHIYDIINIQKQGTGKMIMLPRNVVAFNDYGDIALYLKDNLAKGTEKDENEYLLHEGTNIIKEKALIIKINMFENKGKVLFDKNSMKKYFDYDKIKGYINLRYRKDGDKFTPLGMSGQKKLKNVFIDLKIPQYERNFIPLICFGEEIAWIVGYRVSENYKVDVNTKRILEIIMEREDQ